MLRAITHPTDLSPESELAFAHALSLALLARCDLDILHVKTPGQPDAWRSFPQVREMLQRWRLMDADEPPSDIEARFGVAVRKVEIKSSAGAADGVHGYIARHRTDLVVAATHAREGLPRLLSGSVSTDIALRSRTPTLFLRTGMRPLVDPATGALRLRRIIVPVDAHPAPNEPLQILRNLLESIGADPEIELVHIGSTPPPVTVIASPVRLLSPAEGSLVDLISRQTEARGADLVMMPTAGHDGILDAFRGSTTERVLRTIACPLLAIAAA